MIKNYVLGLTLALVLLSLAPAAQGAGGFFVFQGDINDGTEQTILQASTLDGTPSLENGVSIQLGLKRSGGRSRLFTQTLTYGPINTTDSFVLEGLTFTIKADGSFTVQRTSGSQTYSLIVRGIWIS